MVSYSQDRTRPLAGEHSWREDSLRQMAQTVLFDLSLVRGDLCPCPHLDLVRGDLCPGPPVELARLLGYPLLERSLDYGEKCPP